MEEVDKCLTQLEPISKVRNNLVHREVTFENGRLHVTNEWVAHSEELIEEDEYTKIDLDGMALDCSAIALRLMICSDQKVRRILKPGTLRDIALPWHYKPPKPKAPANRKKKAR